MSELPEKKSFGYPTTQWTDLIDVIQKGGDEDAFAALGELFEQYRPAIRAFFARFHQTRADDLTSAFFENCVIVPWNRRHGCLSPLYTVEDIRRVEMLSQALRERRRPLTEYLWGILGDTTRVMLKSEGVSGRGMEDLRTKFAADFNAIIQGPSIFEPNRFADVGLSLESRNLIGRQGTGHWEIWLNRSLLADAFPGQLTRGIGFLYLVERQEQRKFRTFLAHTMWWFVRDMTKTELKGGVGSLHAPASLDELGEAGFEAPDFSHEEFGRLLDEEFAQRMFALATSQIKHSTQFEAHLRGKITQKQGAEELGLSENAFRQGYMRFRRRLSEALHEEVTKLVGPNEEEVRLELGYLVQCLTN